MSKEPQVSNIDWQCSDCGLVYKAPETDGHQILNTERFSGGWTHTLPETCPECGDHSGWVKRNISEN
jgi:rubredoxin